MHSKNKSEKIPSNLNRFKPLALIASPKSTRRDPFSQNRIETAGKCPFNLNSFSDNRSFTETLHNRSDKGIGCTQKVCKGSILKSHTIKINQHKDLDEAKKENIEFMNLYYQSMNQKGSSFHRDRIEQSEKYFSKYKRYDLTHNELEFACKNAWRNAARCIGRINWSKMKLFDGRHCTTTKEMFDMLCEHLRYATNDGNIRSAITVFRQRIKNKHDFKIWNTQLINYAGYELNDSETIGDKSQIGFTKICEKLGWRGKRTEFDVLPLVLQVDGKEPDFYEIPPELLVQVDIAHPKYENFKELNLKWFAVPAVSGMCLDAGGIYFNCVAFNGWYMNTEIGRDLTEPNRYDKLKVIARALDLDTSANVTLWKDEVLLETNKAILYSFNKAGVTIVDLHTASESFVKHWENEMRLRGGTPSDWVWINPSMSAHITPIFGLEMLNYIIKPYFEYQELPRLARKSIKFKTLMKSLVPFLISFNKKKKIRPKCSILYASQTGKSENFSNQTFKLFSKVFNTKIMVLNDYNLRNLINEELVLLITSTTGNGDSPINGKNLEDFIIQFNTNNINKKNDFIVNGEYSKVRFSILGLGDTSYGDNFGAFPKLIISFFNKLGLKEIYPMVIADQMDNEEEKMLFWLKNALNESIKEFRTKLKITENEIKEIFDSKLLKGKKLKLRSFPFSDSKQMAKNIWTILSSIFEKNLRPFEIVEKEIIGHQPNNEPILRVKLRSIDCDINYSPGNHIEIFGQNSRENVDFILSRLNNSSDFDEIIRLEVLDENLSTNVSELWLSDKKYPAMSIRQALTHYFDIAKPLSQEGCRVLALQALNEKDRENLNKLATDWKAYETWKADYPNLVDLLKSFFSVNPDFNSLLAVLPHLSSRFYSISSCLSKNKREVDITFGVLKNVSKFESSHYGLCTKFMADAPIGMLIPAEIIQSNKFILPKDLSTPIIMIGTGTGIAPFRSFWQQRQIDHQKVTIGEKLGHFILFYGCRDKEKDFLYRDELEFLKKTNVLTEFHVAFSRDKNFPKKYVQEKLVQHSNKIRELVINKNAHIYVCGRSHMANEVKQKLKDIFSEQMNSQKVDEFVTNLKKDNRYNEDIFNS